MSSLSVRVESPAGKNTPALEPLPSGERSKENELKTPPSLKGGRHLLDARAQKGADAREIGAR
jgi:hypothetical protein